MNVAIFGGTFDPVHRGHLAVARAAQRACKLDRIYFVPADVPPHKRKQPVTAFEHRYAMLAIALREDRRFVPSLMESSRQSPAASRQKPNYSIDTVRRFKALAKYDRLFFIVGMDMFQTIGTWYKPQELMREVEFIVVSRPGHEISPQTLQRNAKVHWVLNVAKDVASTELRAALAAGKTSRKWLDDAVVDYIRKEHLYERTSGALEQNGEAGD